MEFCMHLRQQRAEGQKKTKKRQKKKLGMCQVVFEVRVEEKVTYFGFFFFWFFFPWILRLANVC